MDEKQEKEFYFHLIYTELVGKIADLTAAITKNTGQLRELNHIMRVKRKEAEK